MWRTERTGLGMILAILPVIGMVVYVSLRHQAESRVEQVRSQGAGTGRHVLGLPLARQIVLMHHGSLNLESERVQGTTFALRLENEPAVFLHAGNV